MNTLKMIETLPFILLLELFVFGLTISRLNKDEKEWMLILIGITFLVYLSVTLWQIWS